MKKLFFFDIDGTLYNTDVKVPESTKKAIKELQNNGHAVMIATGRAPFLFEDLRDELNIHSYVSLNGQYAVVDGEVIYKRPIEKELLELLTKEANINDHPIVYLNQDNMISNIKSHDYINEGLGSLKFNHDPVHDKAFYLSNDIYQSLLFCTEDEEDYYKEKFTNLDFLRWHRVSLDVLPKGGTKAKTVKKVIEKLGFDEEDVYAFGDGPNDREMLKFVKHSVAMGNAVDETKAVAEYVTDHVDNDGLYKALEHYGFI
ncbi:Cof-type HAD-IIB family hydrolase [Nosocomiicoccus ampullae]|uniref:Cof-type HAD-IIB family hydrolase n=1 Tax=Nosocomiicoccus ampullae TaxID=489910 RepID=UPI0030B841C8